MRQGQVKNKIKYNLKKKLYYIKFTKWQLIPISGYVILDTVSKISDFDRGTLRTQKTTKKEKS